MRNRLAKGVNFQEGAGRFEVQANRLPLSQSLAPIAARIHKLAIGSVRVCTHAESLCAIFKGAAF